VFDPEFHQSQRLRPTGDMVEHVLHADIALFVNAFDQPDQRTALIHLLGLCAHDRGKVDLSLHQHGAPPVIVVPSNRL